jgi:allantoin racemase
LTEWLASVRVVDTTGSQILADPQGSLDALAHACCLAAKNDGAESVILGGAGLVGLANQLVDSVPVPVLDCLEPAIAAARAVGLRRSQLSPSHALRAVGAAFVGIGPDLVDLLSTDIAKGT